MINRQGSMINNFWKTVRKAIEVLTWRKVDLLLRFCEYKKWRNNPNENNFDGYNVQENP